MIIEKISLTDETFDKFLSESYYLSIQIRLDGFSFCVFDPIINTFIAFKELIISNSIAIAQQLEEIAANESILGLKYKKTFIIVGNQYSTLVPSALFKDEKKDELLWLACRNTSNSTYKVLSNKLKMADAVNVFAINTELYSNVKQLFESPIILHFSTPFIEESLVTDQINELNSVVHLHISSNEFWIVVTSARELILANRFSFSSNQDLLYYILYIFEQLKLSASQTAVFANGNVNKSSSEFLFLKPFIKQLTVQETNRNFQLSSKLKNMQLNQFSGLFNSILCE